MPTRSAFERHVQSGLLALVAALVTWNISTTQATTVKVAEIGITVTSLQAQVAQLSAKIDAVAQDPYHRVDAARDFEPRDDRLKDLEARVRALESKK